MHEEKNNIIKFVIQAVLLLSIISLYSAKQNTLKKLPMTRSVFIGGDDPDDDNDNSSDSCEADDIAGAEDQCEFVSDEDRCDIDSKINYLVTYFCASSDVKWLVILFMVVSLIFYFFLLGHTANRFFVPALQRIAEMLRLSPNIAGVTLLAIGNGAPDLFTNYSAVSSELYDQSFGQMFGATCFITMTVVGAVSVASTAYTPRRPFFRDIGFLIITLIYFMLVLFDGKIELGEAIGLLGLYLGFVLVVVFGRILYQKFKSIRQHADLEEERARLVNAGIFLPIDHPIFRIDLQTIAGATLQEKVQLVTKVVEAIESNELSNLESISFLENDDQVDAKHKLLNSVLKEMDVNYLTKIGFWTGKKKKQFSQSTSTSEVEEASVRISTASEDEQLGPLITYRDNPSQDFASRNYKSITGTNDNSVESYSEDGVACIVPLKNRLKDYFDWESETSTPIKKILYIISFIWLIPQHLTIHWCEEKKYFRLFFVANPICSLFFILTVYELWTAEVSDGAGLYIYYLIPAFLAITVVIFFTTKNNIPPVYERVFVFLSLVLSIIWIKVIADEIVGILDALGKIFGIPAGVMGVTVIAWGNSVGDMVANVTIAKKGLPEAAIAACYSAPVFNLLFSLGLALTVKTIEVGTIHLVIVDPFPDLTNITFFSLCFSFVSILISIIVVPLSKFKFPRILGFGLLVTYLCYLILCILDVQGLILGDIYLWQELKIKQ